MLEDGIVSPCLLIVLLTLQSKILPRFLDNRPLVDYKESRGNVNHLYHVVPSTC